MFCQLATEDTLVPPNLRTTHGDVPSDEGVVPSDELDADSAIVIAKDPISTRLDQRMRAYETRCLLCV